MKQNELMTNRLAGSLGSAFSGGKMKIYTGTIPADVNAIITDTLLCEITLPSPAFGVIPANGQVLKTGTWSGTAIANGTAGWCKIQSASGTQFIFATVGEVGDEITINNEDLIIGDTVTVDTLTYTCPEE